MMNLGCLRDWKSSMCVLQNDDRCFFYQLKYSPKLRYSITIPFVRPVDCCFRWYTFWGYVTKPFHLGKIFLRKKSFIRVVYKLLVKCDENFAKMHKELLSADVAKNRVKKSTQKRVLVTSSSSMLMSFVCNFLHRQVRKGKIRLLGLLWKSMKIWVQIFAVTINFVITIFLSRQ